MAAYFSHQPSRALRSPHQMQKMLWTSPSWPFDCASTAGYPPSVAFRHHILHQVAFPPPPAANVSVDRMAWAGATNSRTSKPLSDAVSSTSDHLQFCERCGYRVPHIQSRFCSLCGSQLGLENPSTHSAGADATAVERRQIIEPTPSANELGDPSKAPSLQIRGGTQPKRLSVAGSAKRLSMSTSAGRRTSVVIKTGEVHRELHAHAHVDHEKTNVTYSSKDHLHSQGAAANRRLRPRRHTPPTKSVWCIPSAEPLAVDPELEERLVECSLLLQRELGERRVDCVPWLRSQAVRTWGMTRESADGAWSRAPSSKPRTGHPSVQTKPHEYQAEERASPGQKLGTMGQPLSLTCRAPVGGGVRSDAVASVASRVPGSAEGLRGMTLEHVYGFSSPSTGAGEARRAEDPRAVRAPSNDKVGRRPMAMMPEGQGLVYAAGGVVVVAAGSRQAGVVGLHQHRVSCVALAREHSLAASGEAGEGSRVWVWEVQAARAVGSVRSDVGVICLDFSAGGEWLVGMGADQDCTVMVWNWRTSERPLVQGSSEASNMLDLACVPRECRGVCDADAVTGFATVGVKRVTFWDLVPPLPQRMDAGYSLEATDGEVVLGGERKGPAQVAMCVGFCPYNGGGSSSSGGLACLTGMKDGSVMVWEGGKMLRVLKGWHQGGVACMAVVGTVVVTGGGDGAVRAWDCAKVISQDSLPMLGCATARELEGAGGVQGAGAFGTSIVSLCAAEEEADGEVSVAVGIETSSIVSFRLRQGTVEDAEVVALGPGGGRTAASAVHPEECVLVTVGHGGMMAVWDAADRVAVQRLELVGGDGWRRGGRCVRFRPPSWDEAVVGLETGEVVAVAGRLPALAVAKRARAMAEGGQGAVTVLRFSDDGRHLAAGLEGGAVAVLKAGSGYERGWECWGLKGEVVEVEWTEVGKDVTVKAWDCMGWCARWQLVEAKDPNRDKNKAAGTPQGMLTTLTSIDAAVEPVPAATPASADQNAGTLPVLEADVGRRSTGATQELPWKLRGAGIWYGLQGAQQTREPNNSTATTDAVVALIGDAEGCVHIVRAGEALSAGSEEAMEEESVGLVEASYGGHGGAVTAACVSERHRKAFTVGVQDGAVMQWALREPRAAQQAGRAGGGEESESAVM